MNQLLSSLTKLLLLLALPLLSACGDWLDVGSKSEVDEDQMYENAEGFYTTLTGLYLNMGTTDLYGGNLPLTVLEPLTQQYSLSDDEPDRAKWAQFDYATDWGQTTVSTIWQTMYNTIVNCNLMLEKAAHIEEVVAESGAGNILRGEALALRSYLYFDLARLFNSSCGANSQKAQVPYKTDFGLSIGTLLSNAELLEALVKDLAEARRLLANDPVRGTMQYGDRYLSYDRRQRMNYYAATALMARIELYRAHYAAAASYAQEVMSDSRCRFINAAEISLTDAYGVEQKTDKVFMPEMIFALCTENILSVSRSYYEGLSRDFVKSLNAYQEGDVRRAWFFRNPSANGKINFVRYERSTRAQDAARYYDPVVPMLKLSEMYLILAECALNDASLKIDARATLNQLRTARGESELGATASADDLQKAIADEYLRDFRGEGQLFFYYKRLNMTTIDDGNYNGNTVTVSPDAYVLPLPDYERQFGGQ